MEKQNNNRMIDAVVETLTEERDLLQKRVFTEWINSHLAKVGSRVDDLFTDLQDGILLIKLLEVISAEKLTPPSVGKLRIHKATNVNIAIQFLKRQNINLENIESYDIVDGNQMLILGLIWRIILRYEVQHQLPTLTEHSNGKMSTQDAFLQWWHQNKQKHEKPQFSDNVVKVEPYEAKPHLYLYYFLFYLIFAIISYTLSSN